jgi:hypothetical protein
MCGYVMVGDGGSVRGSHLVSASNLVCSGLLVVDEGVKSAAKSWGRGRFCKPGARAALARFTGVSHSLGARRPHLFIRR